MDANAYPQLEANEGRSVWRSLRSAAGASVWDAFFDRMGREIADVPPPVTTNKLRGPSSAQSRKIGQHACCCIDHLFFDPKALEFSSHVFQPKAYKSAEEAFEELQPSLGNPSDHFPLVVDLKFRS